MGKLLNFKIAIVGAGPAGYFTAQAFQRAQTDELSFEIDMIERLPTPWGLVRSGVAPDHSRIKTISKVFERIAKQSGFKFFGNVELGKDILLEDLRENYDAVVLATGTALGRKLKIEGEALTNSFSAAEFVSWYNGHPDFTNLKVNLNTDTAVVIGLGNVALDVARMLTIDPSELELTDISDTALALLKTSKVKRVVVCGRRGPEHSTFTLPELRDLSNLENVDVYIDQTQIEKAKLRVNGRGLIERDLKNNLEMMQLIADRAKKKATRELEIKFLVTPVQIEGNEMIDEIKFEINEINEGKVNSSGRTFSIKAGLVITAIGYETVEHLGINVKNGRIVNTAGHIDQNIYVTGWAKRGSVGVIGTNKSDSSDVVELIIENLKEPKNKIGIQSLLKPGHKLIDQLAWEKINAQEVISGELVGRPRIKECDWDKLINLGLSR